MLEQLQSLAQRISHAALSVQNIGNCDYVLDAPYARYYRFRFADGFYEVGSYEGSSELSVGDRVLVGGCG